jgi:hypothetical protein
LCATRGRLDQVEPRVPEDDLEMFLSVEGYVSNTVERRESERAWHKLVMELGGHLEWDDVPADIKQSLLDEAERAGAAARADLGSGQGGGGLWSPAWAPAVRRSYSRLVVTTRALDDFESTIDLLVRGDPFTVAEALTDLTSVGDFGPVRWKDGEPMRGAPRAGERTLLRVERVRERLHEEGSAEALRDRRPLPPGIVLPDGHGRAHKRNSRPAPRRVLLKAVVRAERERFRVTREAEWASLRLQGHGVGEIAKSAGVSASTVSETASVRLASSLIETALDLLAVESDNKTELASKIRMDPQRVQRAARGVEVTPDTGPEPPPDADVVDTKQWNLREQSRGLLEREPPSLPELVMGMERDRAERFGKLVQLVADSFAGREPTMLFRREEPHVQRLREIPQRHFGGHRHRRSTGWLDA